MMRGILRATRSVSVAVKITVIALATGMLAAGIGALALVEIGSVADKAAAIYDRGLIPDQDVAKIRESVLRVRHASLSRATAKTPAAADTFGKLVAQYEAAVDQYVNDYRKRPVSTRQKEIVEVFYGHWTKYRELRDKADAQLAANELAAWEATRIEITKTSDAALASLDELSAASAVAARTRLADAKDTYHRSVLLVVVIASIGLLLALALSLVVARAIVKPLRRVRDALNAVAEGDLTQEVKLDSRDELGEMGAALDKTVNTLHDVIQQISGSANSLSDVAKGGASREAGGGGTGQQPLDPRETERQLAEMAESLDMMISLFITRPSTPERV